MSRVLLIAAALGAGSCAHNPGSEVAPDLADVLRLELRLPSQRPGAAAPFDLRMTLRNAGPTPVVFCQLDSGVSVVLQRRGDSRAHPVVLHGIALQPRGTCHAQTRLEPGGGKEFRETVHVRVGLAGPVVVLAYIRVHYPGPLRKESDAPTIRSPVVPMVIQPTTQSGSAPGEASITPRS